MTSADPAGTPVFAVDFESFYDTGFDISSMGPWHYLEDPRCDIYLMGVAGEGFSWAGHPRDFDWRILDGAFVVAHNLAWDGLVMARLWREGVIPANVRIAGGGCTADLASYLGAPRDLRGAARELTGADVSKDLRTWMKGRQWSDAVDAGREDDLRQYVLRDARACFDIWTSHAKYWPEHERLLSNLTMTSGWRGVAINTDLATRSVALLDRMLWEAANDIPWADGGTGVLSVRALAEQCRAAGITPPPSTSEDDPACARWEVTHGERFPWVAAMRVWRKANAMREKLAVMIGRTRATDGCMGFGLKYFGSHTGRWSGSSGFNLQNLPRGESAGVDLRACIVPRPGREFVVCDLAQIEPRILAWLCGDTLLLDQLRAGVPLYEAHARATMGWTGQNLKTADPGLYQLAKARVLGLGYGCGADRFIEVARTMAGITVTPQQASATVGSFRSSNRRITGLWARLQNGLHRSVGEDLEIELPSGRSLTYREVSSSGGWTARVGRGGRRVPFYGGKLCENMVQAVARDVFAAALLRLHRAGVRVVFHVHDEAVCEVDAGTGHHEIERLMSVTPDWLPGCPLAASSSVTNRYCK